MRGSEDIALAKARRERRVIEGDLFRIQLSLFGARNGDYGLRAMAITAATKSHQAT